MLRKSGLLWGISLLWLPLSMLFDGLNSLILPAYLLSLSPQDNQASLFGFVSLIALLFGMLVQLGAASYSDRWRSRWNRQTMMAFGLVLLLPALLLFNLSNNLLWLFLIYLLIQFAANIIQAALQALMPELIQTGERGMASGIKNLMDIAGALLVFMLLAQFFSEGQAHLAMPVIAGVFLFCSLLSFFLLRGKEPQSLHQNTPKHFSFKQLFHLNLEQHSGFARLILARFLFLLGTYAVGRFLLFFVASRLDLGTESAGEESANILSILTLITVALAPLAGWFADKLSRRWLMGFGAGLSALAVLLLMTAYSANQILLYGSLMALGSAAFSVANWAATADAAPDEEAGRFMALANLGTAGAAACAGIFGFLIDFGNQFSPEAGYNLLFLAAALAFLGSAVAVKGFASRIAIPESMGVS